MVAGRTAALALACGLFLAFIGGAASALARAPASSTLCGAISSNTTLTPAGSPYIVTCDVTVNSGVTLTIQPGTTLQFNQDFGMTIYGTLTAVGTSASHIVFTANTATPVAGFWKGITFQTRSSTGQLQYAVVSYGGGNGFGNVYSNATTLSIQNTTISSSSKHGLYATDPTSLTLSSNTFQNNTKYAAYLTYSGLALTPAERQRLQRAHPRVALGVAAGGNVATGNGTNGIGLQGTMNITSSLDLPGAAVPYVVDGLTVTSGTTLSLAAGTVVKFSTATTSLVINGSLSSPGTGASPIVFTSLKDDTAAGDTNNDGAGSTPGPGDWQTIQINAGGGASFASSAIRYGGYTPCCANPSNVLVNGGNLTLTNSTVSNSASNGITAVNPTGLTLTSATFTGNVNYAAYVTLSGSASALTAAISGMTATGNGKNGIGLAGTVGATTSLSGNPGAPYIIDGLTVGGGNTLTIQAGTVVKFSGPSAALTVNGALSVPGTSISPVTFTSIKDDSVGGDTNNDGSGSSPNPGDWQTVQINAGGSANLSYTTLSYGGYTGFGSSTGDIYLNGGSLTLDHSTVSRSATIGINGYSPTALTLTNDTLSANAGRAVFLTFASSAFNPTLSGNTATGNGTNSISLSGTVGASSSLPGAPGIPYVIDSLGLTVAAGNTLTFQQGAVVKFAGATTSLAVNGSLVASGTSTAPVTFTSIKDDTLGGDTNGDGSATSPAGGDWLTIQINAGGAANLTFTTVKYGGYAGYGSSQANVWINGGSLSTTNATIANSATSGVNAAAGATLTLKSTKFLRNGAYGVYAYAPAALTSTSSTFQNNPSYAAYIYFYNSGLTPTISGTVATANGKNGIGLGGTITAATSLPGPIGTSVPYIIDSGLTVASGATLTIQPKAVLKFSGTTASLAVNGSLQVPGTSASPVTFTSIKDDTIAGDTNGDGSGTSPAPGDWLTVQINAGGSANLTFTMLRYGGYIGGGALANLSVSGGSLTFTSSTTTASASAGIYANGGSASLSGSTLSNNASYGLNAYYPTSLSIGSSTIIGNSTTGVYATAPAAVSLTSDTFTNNLGYVAYFNLQSNAFNPTLSGLVATGNNTNGVGIAGALSGASSLPPTPGTSVPYVLDGLTVNSGAMLTIQAGAVVKSSNQTALLSIYGSLSSPGTSGSPVTFTSIKDDTIGGDTDNDGSSTSPTPGDWRGIQVNSGGSANLAYTTLKYGGSGAYPLLYGAGGNLTVANSTFSNGAWDGIGGSGGTHSIQDSTVQNNANVGINFSNGVSLTLSGTTVKSNTNGGVAWSGGPISLTSDKILSNLNTGLSVNVTTPTNFSIATTNIAGNANYGMFNQQGSAVVLNATNTYWGAANGPAPTGSGDRVSAGINFTPFATVPFP